MRVSLAIALGLLVTGCRHGQSVVLLDGQHQRLTFGWEIQTEGTPTNLRGVHAVSDSVAWASGSNGTFARTVDGGSTWKFDTVDGSESVDFRDIHAVDANTAYLLSAGQPAKIFKTTDTGHHWTEQYHDTREDAFFDAIAFWDADHGIAFGDPIDGSFIIITTENGGESWQQVPPRNIPPPIPGEAGFAASGTCLVVHGRNHAWIGTGGSAARVLRSVDRGRTWHVADTPIKSGNASSGIFSLAFANARYGVAVGGDYQKPEQADRNAAVTKDGGKTWTLLTKSQPLGYRSAVAHSPGAVRIFLTVGPSGSELTFDGGRNWHPIGTDGFHALSFTASTGWAVGAGGKIARFRVSQSPKP